MKGTARILQIARLFFASTLLILWLVLVACTSASSPEEVIHSYLSDVNLGDVDAALSVWEFSEVGTVISDLDPEQQKIRLDSREILATELTDALSKSVHRLRWGKDRSYYYGTKNGVVGLVESSSEANMATIGMQIIIEPTGKEFVQEYLAFNLWRNPEEGWRITGIDKAPNALQPILEQLRESY